MTTIAWDGYVLACDSLVTNGNHIFGEADKILKLKDGWFCGAGSMDVLHAVREWLDGGEKPILKDSDTFVGIVIRTDEDGDAFAKEISERLILWDACKPWAGGSGEAYALTAMKCGKGAADAVAIACRMDVFSGGKINTMIDYDTR